MGEAPFLPLLTTVRIKSQEFGRIESEESNLMHAGGDCTSCDIVSGKCKIAPQGTACTDGTCNNKGKCIVSGPTLPAAELLESDTN